MYWRLFSTHKMEISQDPSGVGVTASETQLYEDPLTAGV